MGTLFSPKGVCACGRRAGRLRICGSGRFLGSLSDSVSILNTSGRWALRCSWIQYIVVQRLQTLASNSASAHQSSCSAARRLNPCRLPLQRPSP